MYISTHNAPCEAAGRFTSRDAAEQHAQEFPVATPMHAYRCVGCGSYHITASHEHALHNEHVRSSFTMQPRLIPMFLREYADRIIESHPLTNYHAGTLCALAEAVIDILDDAGVEPDVG